MLFRTRPVPDLSDQPMFAPSAKLAIDLGGAEAARLRNSWVGTEHLALGLLRPGTRGHAFIRALGASPDELRVRLEANCAIGHERTQNLPYTSRAKKVLELAIDEAHRARIVAIEVEYLVLGLLLEEKGPGARALRESGITVASVRSAIENPSVALFRVMLSDNSDLSITEQIVQQIYEATATGQLKPGDRLPTVRSLADELEIAPGTVARAYGELEKRGAIRTDGARGTTIAERAVATLSVDERLLMLSALMRPIAVQGFHAGASADELREGLGRAIDGVRLDRM